MRVIILKMKKIKQEKRNQKWPTHKRKTKLLYYKQKMKIENNWKKWKGSAAIKIEKLKNNFNN